MTAQRVFIKDNTGIGHPTISSALSGKGRMCVETRARIRAAPNNEIIHGMSQGAAYVGSR